MKRFLLTLAAACLLLASCSSRAREQAAAAYAPNLYFSNARLSASENFAGQTIHYIAIEVQNRGPRAVSHLEVMLTFRNSQGQVVLSERATAISPRVRPLGAGEKRPFRLGFDPPPDWNFRSPEVGIARLVLD